MREWAVVFGLAIVTFFFVLGFLDTVKGIAEGIRAKKRLRELEQNKTVDKLEPKSPASKRRK